MAQWVGEVLALASLLSVLLGVEGAPPYISRRPLKEPPCTHVTHATLCWTVRLKQPLHFNLQPVPSPLATPPLKASRIQPAGSLGTSSQSRVSPSTELSSLISLNQTKGPQEIRSGLNFSNGISTADLNHDANRKKRTESDIADKEPGTERDAHDETREMKMGNNDDLDKSGSAVRRQQMLVYQQMAFLVAEEVGLRLLGKVGELYDHFVLCHDNGVLREDGATPGMAAGPTFRHYHAAHTRLKNNDTNLFEKIWQQAETSLHNHHDIAWFTMETVHHRQKRSMLFNDPAFNHQWHLVNHVERGMDINVTGVWEAGFAGQGVTVAVVDDGLEWTNPDLRDNYNVQGSWDLNDNDPDPMPDGAKVTNHHGTRCAGEIAAGANNVCGVGVAYRSRVAGIRLLDGPMTDSLEAEAFNKKFDINAIYSCSWGPDDDGRTVDGPHLLAAKAMKFGVDFGRSGYGSVFVVASGNGGSKQDNCNYDGYANSIYTVTIGAVDESGAMPYYAEECASMLGVTFSSGIASRRDIVTTDWRLGGGSGCTYQHTGTSAAAPLVAGMVALMLDAQPCLTWRDVQYIIIITSVKVDRDLAHWQKNEAGLEHSHKHGFGLIKAWRLVNAARVWRSVPWMTSYSVEQSAGWQVSHGVDNPLIIRHTVTAGDTAGYSLYMLEYVQVTLTLSHPHRGKLGIHLRCPSNTLSVIGAPRPHDNSSEGFSDWTFSTVRCWGESPTGDWTLVITDSLPSDSSLPTGWLTKWRLTLFGTPITTREFIQRKREVEEAMNGHSLNPNVTPHCYPPPVTSPPDIPLSEKTLKVLFLSGVFCLIFALYETFEYIVCYNEEKKQQQEETQRALTLVRQQPRHYASDQTVSESARLLSENSERDAEWLRQSQDAFEEDEDDDMFLMNSGILAGIQRARQKKRGEDCGGSSGERIRMSSLTASLSSLRAAGRGESGQAASLLPQANRGGPLATEESGQAASLLPQANMAAKQSGSSGAVRGKTPGCAPQDVAGNMELRSCLRPEVWAGPDGGDRQLPADSILPDLWHALAPRPHSDSDSAQEELFDCQNESSTLLQNNSAAKSSFR